MWGFWSDEIHQDYMTHSFIQMLRTFLQTDGATLLPELELLLFVIGVLAMDRWLEAKEKHWNAWLAISGIAFSVFTLWTLRAQVSVRGGLYGFHQSLFIDPYFLFFSAILLSGVTLVIVLSAHSPDIQPDKVSRFYAFILLASTGMLLMLSGTNLIPLFLGIEIMSFSFYLLGRTQPFPNTEDSTPARSFGKTVAFRASASIFVFAGFAALYRLAASFNIGEIGLALGQRSDLARAIALANQPGARGEGMRQLIETRMPDALKPHFFPLQTFPMCAIILIAIGLFLKVASAASSGSTSNSTSLPPTPISAFASIAAASASFALLLRLLLTVFAASQDTWLYIAEISSLFILALTGIVAVFQASLRKLLACLALSQFAFMLLALVSANETGIYGLTFYLLIYVFMLAGVYLVLSLLRQNEGVAEKVQDLRGLYHRNPAAAFLFAVFLLSLAGIPATSGFLAKYAMLKSLFVTHHTKLAIAAIILFLPTLYACLRVATESFRKSPEEQPRLSMTNSQAIALGICLFVTLAAGLYPEPFRRLAHYAFGQ